MNLNAILANFNITQLNPMQYATLESIPAQGDVVLISPTGSGKTLAVLLPLLKLLKEESKGVQTLILVPSRELAIQIEQVFKQMSTGYKINCCYGGHDVRVERNNLQHPPALLVGTPGRIAYHLRKGNVDVDTVHQLVLDEFDKSLEAGFQEDMSFIIGQLTHLKKRVLTSATELKEIPEFVKLKNAKTLDFTTHHQEIKPSLEFRTVKTNDKADKLETLMLLVGKLGAKSTIVFCNHRDAVNRISQQLHVHKIAHGMYHGGMEQIDREKTLIKLRNGSTRLLISTDLASRGLDIPEIEAVVHYQMPTTEETMIHRNGRTARMNASGTVYFILDEDDYLPEFLEAKPEIESLPTKMIQPPPVEWKTLYIAAGKKDKVNKMDIVGLLLKKGDLQKEEVGKIEVLDYSAYVAVKSQKIVRLVQLLSEERIKNKKVKMEISS